jgi:hypothetical protein
MRFKKKLNKKMSCFQLLGLPDTSTEQQVLKAWRAMAMKYHPDKQQIGGGAGQQQQNDAKMKELNEAKEACLSAIFLREYKVDELDFARFVAKKIEKSIERRCALKLDLHDGELLKNHLRKFMWYYAVDAMEWVLRMVIREYEFDQETEDDIPVLCKFYNAFIGQDNWEEDEHTFMMVLNKYDQIKAGGYGNFGQLINE